MKNLVNTKAPDRDKLRAYFSGMGLGLSESLVTEEECFVMTASGCPGGGKSLMTDEVMNGALTASIKRLDDRSFWEGDDTSLYGYTYFDEDGPLDEDGDPIPQTDPYAYIASGERTYDMWQGESAKSGQPLQAFFFNAAILPRGHGEDVVRRVLGVDENKQDIPSSIYTFYNRPNPRTYMKLAGQLILITQEGECANVNPDFHADLSYTYKEHEHLIGTYDDAENGFGDDDFLHEDLFDLLEDSPTGQMLSINYNEDSPYAKKIEAAHEANKHHLGLG